MHPSTAHPTAPQNTIAQKVAADKSKLRFYLRRQRNRLAPTQNAAQGFATWIGQEVENRGHRLTVAAFLPLKSEPPITDALTQLVSQGHRVLVPVVLPQRQLGWVQWNPNTPCELNVLGISEPVGERLGSAAFCEADLRLVPALALSSRGRRLGQGGGYYDRLFELLGDRANQRSTLGVVFDREILDDLPAHDWDAVLGYALTESGVKELGTCASNKTVE
ncbi:MAG: 5-formyltetrahydrofolate cyclo-ligase [Rothia sp. (in: high G+C Gram-positive bacteria)]|nr:5-formyltetrahydrofolate cyclo-ligase [Rothia sp. (in: high G+C Gram-positive bacteria)]